MVGVVRRLIARFELVPGQHRPRPLRNDVIFAVLIALALGVGLAREVPFTGSGGTRVLARFAAVPNLREGHPVRVAGIDVGEVTGIDRDPDGGVLVEMRIEDAGVAVRRDASAALLWRTLFGRNMYVDLDPGSPAAPPLGGRAIPESRTEVQVEFDQLLEPLDRSGRRALRTAIRELDAGLGDGGAPARTIDRLQPAMRNAAPTLEGLRGERRGDLGRLVRRARRMSGALAASERQLGRVVAGGARSFEVLAAERSDLGRMVRDAPRTLRETETTMVRLRRTLGRLDPLARRLRPGLRRLDEAASATIPALREAAPLLRAARPLVETLGPTAEALRRASDPGTGLFAGLDPTLDRVSGEVLPFLERRGELGLRNSEALGPFFSAWATSMAQYDAYGHMNRFQVFGGERFLTTIPCDTFFTEPGAEERVDCQALEDLLGALLGDGP